MAFQNKVIKGAQTHNGRTYKPGESFTSNRYYGKDNEGIESTELTAPKMVRNVAPKKDLKKK